MTFFTYQTFLKFSRKVIKYHSRLNCTKSVNVFLWMRNGSASLWVDVIQLYVVYLPAFVLENEGYYP